MAEIVNLNRARKNRARDQKRENADINSAKFGRTKAERVMQATRNENARKMLDQHIMDEE